MIDDFVNVADMDMDPRIIEEPAIHFEKEFTIPVDNFRHELGDINDRVLTGQFQHAPKRETKAQTANQHAGFRR